ncbi:MAG: hypothetical protein J7621_13240 [Niastella sp.]|nr:hypothetical protein [Niastella sp.]
MRRLLLVSFLLPVFAVAQEVKPVLSKDYLDLISKDSLPWSKSIITDTTNSIRKSLFRKINFYDGFSRVQKVIIRKDGVYLKPAYARRLVIGGSISSTAAIKHANRMPRLQSGYVQGRSQNGMLQWRGPETNELFSYGPAISDLEFDNSNYVYDVNGRLVPAGTGSGKKANAYDNDIIRTGSFFEQGLTAKARYLVNGARVLTATVRLGQSTENLVISNNKNTTHNFSTSLEAYASNLTFTGGYTTIRDRISNNNRYGFLNRTYQQSLLTPVSFDNGQGYVLGMGQRSYSVMGDNPLFLLKDDNNSFGQLHQTGSVGVEKKYGNLRFKMLHSIESLRQNGDEVYKVGTAGFPDGRAVARKKNDANYQLTAEASMTHHFYPFDGTAGMVYYYGANKTDIGYQPGIWYHYQRSSHDISLYYQLKKESYNINYGVNLLNKMYASNTSTKDNFFLPNIMAFVTIDDLFDVQSLRLKVVGAYNRLVSELPIDKSFAALNLLQYSTEQALGYLPVREIAGFDGLQPVRHEEWTARMELDYQGLISFQGEFFVRNNRNDVFPIFNNGQMQLANMADHRNEGVELSLRLGQGLWKSKNFSIIHDLSFFTYNNVVTQVRDGYNGTSIAGFSNVHKALVKGSVLGAIMGSSYQRDANNNVMIGNDGYPLENPTPAVIGNPIPDFVIKLNNNLVWKKFFATVDVEWKKGGDVWNGTQAVLDYYGRSANSGALRTVTNYVFPGVLANNHVNDIPVKFYDPAQPLENNRWVRYGHSGVAEDYIQRGDYIRINNISLGCKIKCRKYPQMITVSAFAGNILIWTPYKGGDPSQLLYDQPNTDGLDFFNLPSVKNLGVNVSLQF